MLCEEAPYKRSHPVGFHLYEQPATSKSIKTGSRLMAARGWGKGGMGSHCLMAVGFPLSVTKSSRMRYGNDYITLSIYLMPLNCMFYIGKNGKLYIVFYHDKKAKTSKQTKTKQNKSPLRVFSIQVHPLSLRHGKIKEGFLPGKEKEGAKGKIWQFVFYHLNFSFLRMTARGSVG